MQYKPSTLQRRKGKWYVCVTKPKELTFGTDTQARRSTGTSDKRQAQLRQHELTQVIYDEFDTLLERSDKFYESIRPLLEKEGINTKQWYTNGYITVDTSAFKGRGMGFMGIYASGLHGIDRNPDGKYQLQPTIKISTHVDLCKLLTALGHSIPLKHFQGDKDELQSKELSTDALLGIADRTQDHPVFRRNVIEQMKNFAVDAPEVQTGGQTLGDLLDRYKETRPEKSRKNDRWQLRKWHDHPDFGKKPLKDVTVYDAYDFLNEIGEDSSASSIRVLRAAMSNVFKWANKHRDLDIGHNPWIGLDLKGIGSDAVERLPFTHDQLYALFQMDMPEEDRKAFAILITTGMRIGELHKKPPVREQGSIRYMDLREDDPKTKGSRRLVPLHDNADVVPVSFSKGRLREHIRNLIDDPRVVPHSLRHTFKDLARDAGVPKEVSDFITGHRQGDVAAGYGQGPSLRTRYEAIMSIDHPWL